MASPSGGSLYDTYSSSPVSTKRVVHSATRTSRLRTSIVKLSCYLNCEADRSRATVVRLPEECDTLGEVIPKIHKRMGMDKRIAYAAELFLPDGKKIKTYDELLDAAANDHAIIVGCGEKFDPTTIPYDLLEAYLHGGGRDGLKKVKQELNAKQKFAAQEKADTVRSSGHGIYPNSAAVVTARAEVVDAHKTIAAEMRHEYMEQLMFRAEQQKALNAIVAQNTTMMKSEAQAAKDRRKVMDAARIEKVVAEKNDARAVILSKRETLKAKIKMKHDRIHQQYESHSYAHKIDERNPYGPTQAGMSAKANPYATVYAEDAAALKEKQADARSFMAK